MKLKAILKGNELTLPTVAILKKPEIEVEVEIPDEDVQIFTDEDLKKLPFDELVKLVWRNANYDEGINRDYKEIVGDALAAHYREKNK